MKTMTKSQVKLYSSKSQLIVPDSILSTALTWQWFSNGLSGPPFEPLEENEFNKSLLTLASATQVSDIPALSVHPS